MHYYIRDWKKDRCSIVHFMWKDIQMDKKGFTLIEMIVVITVIGVLAAIAVPSLMAYIDKGKASDCEINRKALVLKLEAERAQAPGASMEEIIKNNPEIQCPAGGIYTAVDKDTVKCSYPGHGQDGTFHEEGETQNIEIGEIVPTLTEEENSTEDVQESSSAEGTETENNGKPGGLTGDRCIFLSQGSQKKQSSLLVKSIADFAEDYHKKHPNAEKVEEGDFTDNVLWIYEEENIYYFNPGNCISITYSNSEDGGYSYQVSISEGVIPVTADSKVVTADEIGNAVKTGGISISKGTIIEMENEKTYYICVNDKFINKHNWKGEINNDENNSLCPLTNCK